MKRNSALRGLAWLGATVVALATPVSQILFNEANYGVAVVRAGKVLSNFEYLAFLATHPDNADIAWWAVFAAFFVLTIWLGRVFVSLWGEDKRASKVGQDAVAKALAL